MRVVYSDESGTGSEKDEPLTVIVALMLNIDRQWHPLLAAVEDAIADALELEDISNYEVKGRTLYHQIKRGDEKADALLSALIALPKAHRLPVFYGAVDRDGLRFFMQEVMSQAAYNGRSKDYPIGPLDTFEEAMERCITLVDSYVHTVFPSEQVLWIHDKGRYDESAKGRLNDVRNIGPTGAGQLLREVISEHGGYLEQSHIVDMIYFGDSQESRALQLADVCCSTITRYLRGDRIADKYYELLRSQIVNEGSRPLHESVREGWESFQQRVKRERDGRG